MIKLGKRTFGHFWKTYLNKLTDFLALIVALLINIGMGAVYLLAIAGWIFHWWLSIIGIILVVILTPLVMMLRD